MTTIVKAMCDVNTGDTIDGRKVISHNQIGQYVTLDFGDNSPLVRRWYAKVAVGKA